MKEINSRRQLQQPLAHISQLIRLPGNVGFFLGDRFRVEAVSPDMLHRKENVAAELMQFLQHHQIRMSDFHQCTEFALDKVRISPLRFPDFDRDRFFVLFIKRRVDNAHAPVTDGC